MNNSLITFDSCLFMLNESYLDIYDLSRVVRTCKDLYYSKKYIKKLLITSNKHLYFINLSTILTNFPGVNEINCVSKYNTCIFYLSDFESSKISKRKLTFNLYNFNFFQIERDVEYVKRINIHNTINYQKYKQLRELGINIKLFSDFYIVTTRMWKFYNVEIITEDNFCNISHNFRIDDIGDEVDHIEYLVSKLKFEFVNSRIKNLITKKLIIESSEKRIKLGISVGDYYDDLITYLKLRTV